MSPQFVTTVPRFVQSLDDQEDRFSNHVDGPLEVYRDTKAWVLLGEPGAGKSTSLRSEATTTDGKYLTVSEFVDVDVVPERLGKTLFLDGLDEFRASGRGTIIQKVCNQLKHLGKPPFRLACRAADWYGSSDKDQLRKVSRDEEFSVLQLTPLSNCDIRQLLRDNYRISNTQEFIDTAERRGVAVLLQNPQTLGLLAQAVRHSDWPRTRDDTYGLACKMMVKEENKSHRDMKRASGNKYSPEQLINAAGQLCTVLLLADKSGVALDPDGADNHFPDALEDIANDIRNENSDLWRGLRKQLVEKYSIAPKAHGHGIYLVLWFGIQNILMAGGDGGKKPRSAQHLEKRMKAIIEPSQHASIFVRTIDVS